MWLGDIYGDGKLDVLMDSSGMYGEDACFYLSGNAKDGQIFGEPACQAIRGYEGC